MANFERLRLLGSTELPVYDLGEPRRVGASPSALIEHAVLAGLIAGSAGFCLAVAWWIAG